MEVQIVPETVEIEVKDLNFYYSGTIHALKKINLPVYKNAVTALIGPSGCGKTTLLRCFNRMHDLYPKNRYEGEILFQGREHPLEWDGPYQPQKPHRNGLSETDPVPYEHI